ncbi:MAG: glycosyltransferase [Alphaproteobacteria bacterium]
MHVAFLLSDLKGGGAQKMVINLANWFAGQGHKSELVLVNDEGDYKGLIADNVIVRNLDKPRTFQAIPALARYLKGENPDILFSALYHVNVAAVLGKTLSGTKTKLVISERNYMTRSLGDYSVHTRLLWRFLMRFFYPFSNHIVGISNGVCDDLKGRLPTTSHKKIQTIYNPVVTAEFEDSVAKKVERVFPDHSSLKLITSGRLVPQKDYPTLLKSFALYLEKDPQAHLVILGDGALKEELKSLSDTLGVRDNITFKGFVDEPLAHIKQADIFIMTSAWEGFCNVIVEALYCGLKVISTDCPAGPAEILEDGEYGMLCPVGDSRAIAHAIEECAKEDLAPETQKERALHFHVDKIGTRFLKKFEELVE